MSWTVYVLRDDSGIRYVGCTRVALRRRLYEHLVQRAAATKEKQLWLNALAAAGKPVTIIPISTHETRKEATAAERDSQVALTLMGAALVNKPVVMPRNDNGVRPVTVQPGRAFSAYPKEQPLQTTIFVYMTQAQKDLIKVAADIEGMSLSDYCIKVANERAAHELRQGASDRAREG